jgi:hypothetical protein
MIEVMFAVTVTVTVVRIGDAFQAVIVATIVGALDTYEVLNAM